MAKKQKCSGFPVRRLELSTIACLLKFFDLYRAIGVSMPWIVNLALLNLGYSGARSEDLLIHSDGEQIFNGRDIAPDPVLISDEAQAVNGHALARTLKPIFDRIWRPFGFSGSPYFFKDTGEWIDLEEVKKIHSRFR